MKKRRADEIFQEKERGGATPLSRYSKQLDTIVNKNYNSYMRKYSFNSGFTLAEVLITLAIIGVVAAITIPSLVTKITNKGYVEKLKKNYALIQDATKMIVAEEGDPAQWAWSAYNSGDYTANEAIVENYKKHLKVIDTCPATSDIRFTKKCVLDRTEYSYLNGSRENVGDYAGGYALFYCNYILMLADGTTLGIRFGEGRCGYFWGTPNITFTIDVNGKAGPNTIGRDIFYVYMMKNEHGKIKPYTNEIFPGTIDNTNTCNTDSTGQSCAYRVLTEGRMNY